MKVEDSSNGHKDLIIKLMNNGVDRDQALLCLGTVCDYANNAYCQDYSNGYKEGYDACLKESKKF